MYICLKKIYAYLYPAELEFFLDVRNDFFVSLCDPNYFKESDGILDSKSYDSLSWTLYSILSLNTFNDISQIMPMNVYFFI